MATWIEDSALQKSLIDQMMYVSMRFSRQILHTDLLMDRFGMPMSEIQLLFAASEKDYTIGELADYMGVHKPNVAPIVNALVKKGYIERVASETDGRKIYVHSLPEGKKCIEQIRSCICEQLIQKHGVQGNGDAKNLNKALGTLVRTMKTHN